MPSFSDEILAKAKTARNAEELLDLAKDSGIKLIPEQVQLYFARRNPRSEELADEELDNVSGGACSNTYTADGVRLVLSTSTCAFYQCNCCQGTVCRYNNNKGTCISCSYFENLIGYGMKFSLCRNPRNFRQ